MHDVTQSPMRAQEATLKLGDGTEVPFSVVLRWALDHPDEMRVIAAERRRQAERDRWLLPLMFGAALSAFLLTLAAVCWALVLRPLETLAAIACVIAAAAALRWIR